MTKEAFRIVYKPLLVSAGGSVLQTDNMDSTLFVVDPLKYGHEGLLEAARFANPRGLAQAIAVHPDAEAVMRHLFNPEGDPNPGYKKTIHTKPGMPGLEREIIRYLEEVKAEAQSHPEKLFPTIDASRARARRDDERINDSMAYTPPEYLPELLGQKADSGYPNDHEFISEASEKMKFIRGLIKKLPDYLRANIEAEPVTIAITGTLPRHFAGAGRSFGIVQADSNLIALNNNRLDEANAPVVLREEVAHYLDHKIGFAQRREFREAADRLYADKQVLGRVEDALKEIHAGNDKLQLSHIDKHYIYPELLAEYVHLKEQARGGQSRVGRHLPGADAKIHRKMEEIFGKEFADVADGFERELRLRARTGGIRENTR